MTLQCRTIKVETLIFVRGARLRAHVLSELFERQAVREIDLEGKSGDWQAHSERFLRRRRWRLLDYVPGAQLN